MFSNAATSPWGSQPWSAVYRNRERWERDVGSARKGGGDPASWKRKSGPTFSSGSRSPPNAKAVASMTCRLLVDTWPRARIALLALTATAAAATAFAAAVAMKAYVDNPPNSWAEIMSQRRHSPIWDREGRLAGSAGFPAANLDREAQRNLAFIPLADVSPPNFVKALLQLEDRNFGAQGWRTWCGIDAPALVWRWVSSGGVAGGSGLLQQFTRQMKPEWGGEKTLIDKATRKFAELGASCALWQSYQIKGGSAAILADYASTAPMLQGGGTLRGLEAASHITYGVKPRDLTDAQQILFAAAVKLPLRMLQPGDLSVSCEQVYPASSPVFDAQLATAHPARVNQCRVIWRAISAAVQVLQGQDDRLKMTLDEFHEMQRSGIHITNELQPLPAARVINLTGRTAAMLPPVAIRMLTEELDNLSGFQWGDDIKLTFDAVAQRKLSGDVAAALNQIQKTGKHTLCIPLIRTEPMTTGFTPLCGRSTVGDASADVIAIKINVADGAVVGAFSSSPTMLDAPLSAGSLAKWVIVLAAVEAGIEPDSEWCPRKTSDGTRPLRRVGRDPYGYTDAQCARGGRYLVRLVDAIARSDNLVAAEVARHLGDARLKTAIEALGLHPERDHDLWYSLSFGTQPATPRSLLIAGRALVAAAYGVKTTGAGPRALAGTGRAPADFGKALELDPLSTSARASLRRLLEAPVSVERGTLGFVGDVITAGKTGTTSSNTFDVNGHRNVNAKLALSYQADQGVLNLLVVAAPKPGVPLALHNMPASLLAPAHRALLQPR